MRGPIYSNLINAIGTATWGSSQALVLPVDYIQLAFGLTAGGIFTEDGALTYSYFLTLDSTGPENRFPCTIAQTTTTITVTDGQLAASSGQGGVTTADIVKISGSGRANTDIWGVVASTPSTTTYTFTSPTSQTVAANTPAFHSYWRLFAAPTAITGATTRVSAAVAHSTTGPCTGLVLKVTARTTGGMVGVVLQGYGPG